jgi:hypothetical protein
MNGAQHPYSVYLICLWPLALLIAWAISNAIRDTKNERATLKSLNWPETRGHVVSSKVVWGHVSVSYNYTVETREYAGRYKMNLPPRIPNKDGGDNGREFLAEAKQAVNDYPVGSKLLIRYNPARPQESVIYCSDEDLPEADRTDSSTPMFHSLDD